MEDNRLPSTITPSEYDIFLDINFDSLNFNGKENIFLDIKKETSKISLHSLDLKIKSVILKLKNKNLIPKISFNKEKETLELEFKEEIKRTKAELTIEFSGEINESLDGLYKSKYLDKNKKEKYLLTTQFEAPYARKCFPCFDEPNKKAIFKFSLKIPKELKAISNMPIEKEINENSKKVVVFQKTPVMPTYLAYLGVGDFEFLEDSYKKVKLRAITTHGKSKDCRFALDLTKKFLKYFEDFSNISYPLPKLDIIAIPDFSAGAMENWGAITFREVLLLHNNKTSAQIEKTIAEVLAHELWHQWSGNLVTMDWWEDLWLNESFANYMAYKALDFYFPEWRNWEDYIAQETEEALMEDSLETTHPIAVKVENTNEIEEIFDKISYNKGGSILRMINSYLGEEKFKEGISNYLSKYKYKNAKASDLWECLSKTSKGKIKEIMENWINTPGYPIIKTERQDKKIKLSQKRFSIKKHETLWKIPLIIQTSKKEIKDFFDKEEKEIIIKDEVEWYKINPDSTGFYRTEYSKEDLEKLKPLIISKRLSPINRWQIQNDLFNLSLLGFVPISEYFDLLETYKNEDSYLVLSDISINIRNISLILSNSKELEEEILKIKKYFKEPFKKSLLNLSWEPKINEPKEDIFLRTTCLNYLAFAEDKEIISLGLKKFEEFLKNPESIDKDVKYSVFYIASIHGNKETYNSLLKLYEESENPEEKVKLLSCLYKFRDNELLSSSLSFALSDKVRLQNLRTVFSSIPSNKEFRPLFFEWTKENWNKISEIQKTSHIFQDFIDALVGLYLNDKKQEISEFLESKKVKFKQTKANAFEKMYIRSNFLEKNKQVIKDYFVNK